MTFVLSTSEPAFISLKAAKDSGDDAAFANIANALTVVYGGDGITTEDVNTAFDAVMVSQAAQIAVDQVKKDVAGHTVTNPFTKMVIEATEAAKKLDGTVVIVASVDTEGKVALNAIFKGVDGIKSGRGGGGNRTGVRYKYFDGGTLIEISLKKYLAKEYPKSEAVRIITEYALKPNSSISAFGAAERGMKDGDKFVITRIAKGAESASS